MFSNRLFGPSGIPGAAGQLAQNVQGSVAPAPLPAKQTVTVNTETVINNPALSAQPLLVSIPASALLEQNIFEIHASGYIKCNASSTLTLKLYSGSSATVGSDTLLKSSGAVSAFQATVPFYIIAQLVYDSVSGKLGGTVKFMVNNTHHEQPDAGSGSHQLPAERDFRNGRRWQPDQHSGICHLRLIPGIYPETTLTTSLAVLDKNGPLSRRNDGEGKNRTRGRGARQPQAEEKAPAPNHSHQSQGWFFRSRACLQRPSRRPSFAAANARRHEPRYRRCAPAY
jgi:hypothetical protein